jgi:uncharacterized membrane protein SpoIIM required for sporulation
MGPYKYQGFFSGLLHRNEWFIYLSTGIFFGAIVIGYLIPGFLEQILISSFNTMKKQISEGTLQLTTISIFFNNLKVALILYGGGAIFGLLTALSLFFNGLFVGYAANQFPLGDFIILTIPHGIPEVIGIIFAGAAGFRLGTSIIMILRSLLGFRSDISFKSQLYNLWEENETALRDSVYLFLIAVVLIIIAAFIEANLTLAWAHFIKASI